MSRTVIGEDGSTYDEFVTGNNANFTEIEELNQSNWFQARNTTGQLIPRKVWTPITWDTIDYNSSSVTLDSDLYTWRRPYDVPRSRGLFNSVLTVWWDVDDAAIIKPMRAAAIFNSANEGDPYFIPWVNNERLYIPSGDTTIPFSMTCYMQDGFLPGEADMLNRLEIWHNAEVPVSITKALFVSYRETQN